jgi:hypothetical protein
MNARELELMQFSVPPRFVLVGDDVSPLPPLLTHYCGDSASTNWLRELAAMDREDSLTPAQWEAA